MVGGDLAGFPNGRRVFDDVVTIELRAIAGLTFPLVDPAYTPDAAASQITDGLTPADIGTPTSTRSPTSACPTTATTTRTRPRFLTAWACAPSRGPGSLGPRPDTHSQSR